MDDMRRAAETEVLARIPVYLHRVDPYAWFAVAVLVSAAVAALVFGGGPGWVIGAVVVAALIVSLEVTVLGAPDRDSERAVSQDEPPGPVTRSAAPTTAVAPAATSHLAEDTLKIHNSRTRRQRTAMPAAPAGVAVR